MAKQFHFLRVPDATLTRLAQNLLAMQDSAEASFSAGDGIPIILKHGETLKEEWAATFGTNSYLIFSGSIKLPDAGFELKYYRGQSFRQHPHGDMRWMASENVFVDGIELTGPSNIASKLSIIGVINEFLSLAPPVGFTAPGVAAFEQSSAIINQVSAAITTLVEHTSERQIQLDATKDNLEQQTAKRLADETEILRTEHARELNRIAEITDDLNNRSKLLDDRENTHVRRELQKNMALIATDSLTQKLLQKSEISFQQARFTAAIFSALLIGVATWQSLSLSHNPAISETVTMFAEVRILLLGAGAAALIWYALRLSTSRFKQVSRWENDLNRFRLDVERAGFLIEGDLEARRVSDTGLPEVMLQRFSQGLFSGADQSPSSDQDDIGSTLGHLLSRAATVKVGTDGVNVEIDRSGIKRARKDVAKDSLGEEL